MAVWPGMNPINFQGGSMIKEYKNMTDSQKHVVWAAGAVGIILGLLIRS